MNTLEKAKLGWRKYLRVSALAFATLSTIVLFQNCNSAGDAASSAASGGNTITTPPPTTCPRTSNAAPVVTSLSSASTTFKVGMGLDAGSERTKTITANFNSGDNYSAVVATNCQVVNNAGLTVNCNDPNTPTPSGSFNISISAANGAECTSGTVTVNISVEDTIVTAQNVPINACSNLDQNSSRQTLTINVQNGCLPTQRVNPTAAYDNGQMGRAVAIDNDWAVTTVPGDEDRSVDAGAAYVMRRTGTTWAITQKLIPASLTTGNLLSSVAISGNLIVLGSSLANSSEGRAWIFQFNGSQWVEIKELIPPAGALQRFGHAVAVSGTNVAISSPGANLAGQTSGAVYVFSGAGFNSMSTLMPSGSTLIRGEFGSSLAYSGTTLAVGAPFPNNATTRLESVYIFNNSVLSQKLSNAANAAHRFGYSVSLDGSNLAIGAPYHTAERGIAYLYQAAGGVFPTTATRSYVLADPNNTDIDHFGHAVSVKGTRVAVSAPDKAEGQPKFGAVYLFGTADNVQQFKIRSQIADRGADSFGQSVGLSADGWLVSGAMNDENVVGTDNSGSIYFVDLP